MTFQKGDKVKMKDGSKFSNDERVVTVSHSGEFTANLIETNTWVYTKDIELVEQYFKTGDKVMRRDGSAFSNGQMVATVQHDFGKIADLVGMKHSVYSDNLKLVNLEPAKQTKQVPTPVVQTFDMLTQKEESLFDKKYELQNKLKEIENQLGTIKTAKEALQKLDLS
jgi:hypothetical protein